MQSDSTQATRADVPAEPRPPGKIITFYSYKGGTGRSMALANMAWLLAASGKKVLIVDWDLEAPGIHRYFKPFLIDEELASSDGLIDLLWEFVETAVSPVKTDARDAANWYERYADPQPYIVSVNTASLLKGGQIDLLPAGKQGAAYATRINLFDWSRFYSTLGGGRFLEVFRDHVRREYDFVLIDSRTGVSDTSGICTVQMPDALVVCFTYNNQSIKGASTVAQSAVGAREQLDAKLATTIRAQSAGSPLVFPVPTRVDQTELDKLASRRRYARAVFDPLLAHIPESKRGSYWLDVEIPHIPYFAYEEIVAPFRERADDPKSALAATARLMMWIDPGIRVNTSGLMLAAEQDAVRRAYASTPLDGTGTPPDSDKSGLAQAAERYFNDLTLDGQLRVRSVVLFLVGLRSDGTRESPYRVRYRAEDLPGRLRPTIDALQHLGVVRQIADATGRAAVIELADDTLLREWPRIPDIVAQNVMFMRWRERFRSAHDYWAQSPGESSARLLQGPALVESEEWLERQKDDLSESEQRLIETSSVAAKASQRRVGFAKAFIVRPFNFREGVDFDAVERVLIQPALRAAGIEGATSAEFVQAGSIREDIFRSLVTAELVIADLSIHNANVFYELGIRHGLQPRGTLLIRADLPSYPFDLQTDRFLLYDANHPEEHVDSLAKAITATLSGSGTDSPVFRMLPNLRAPDPTALRVVPREFRETVTVATEQGLRGDLWLLAQEAEGFEWASEGVRTVGREQFLLRAWSGAKESFESLRRLIPSDIEANQRLGTVYQRLGDLAESTQAIGRVIDAPEATPQDRAEAFALQGRNAKSRWLARLKDLSGQEAQVAALRAPELTEAIDRYSQGFEQDLNHFYSGLNALSLLQIRNTLADALPSVWVEAFAEDGDAERALKESRARFEQLADAVPLSINAREAHLKRQFPPDRDQLMWVALSRADHTFLIGAKPAFVRRRYVDALTDAPEFVADSARTQLEIFHRLGIRQEFVAAALAAIDEKSSTTSTTRTGTQVGQRKPTDLARVLLFTGHMIDAPGRPSPRFPPTDAAEAAARRMIRESIEAERRLASGAVVGIAGGGCGGDILFHEICEELGLESRVFLALPQKPFSEASVRHAGKNWIERYDKLCARVPPRVLSDHETLPFWLKAKPDYSIWRRNSLWMLFNALALDAKSLTLLALWDGAPADGPGGTEDLVTQVSARRHKVVRLAAEHLKEAAV